MRIVFMGTPDFAVPSLARLLADGHEIRGVFTQPDKPQGRKQVLTPPPVKSLALEHGLAVYQPATLKNGAASELLAELDPELIVVAAYGKILPKYVLDYPRLGCINAHGSLLPRWRGAAPIQWSVIAGDEKTGVTIMQMDEGLDTGAMLAKCETAIGERETAGELFDRLSQDAAALLSDTIRRMAGGPLCGEPQDESKSCYAHMLDKEIAVVDWTKSAREVDCLIRGLNPWPVALTTLAGERLKIYSAAPAEGGGAPGEVLCADPKRGMVVACGAGALALGEVQAVGGRRMRVNDWLRGHTVHAGIVLGG